MSGGQRLRIEVDSLKWINWDEIVRQCGEWKGIVLTIDAADPPLPVVEQMTQAPGELR